MKNYLLATATVTPPADEPWLVVVDPKRRLHEYIEAFKYYLSDQNSSLDGIIFVDNSNHPLEEIRQIAQDYRGHKQIEVLSFFGLDYPVEYGRSHGELKLIDYAYMHSQIMQNMKEEDRFWKVTGRFQVLTINKLISSSKQPFDLCADFKFRKKRVDTRLMAMSIRGYKKYIYGKSHELSGQVIEEWLFEKLMPLLVKGDDLVIKTEFRVVPIFKGFSGGNNYNYMSYKQQVIYFMRSVYLTLKYFIKS